MRFPIKTATSKPEAEPFKIQNRTSLTATESAVKPAAALKYRKTRVFNRNGRNFRLQGLLYGYDFPALSHEI
jgi:hypothetical protein